MRLIDIKEMCVESFFKFDLEKSLNSDTEAPSV